MTPLRRIGDVTIGAILLFMIAEAIILWLSASHAAGMVSGVFNANAPRSVVIRSLPVVAGTALSLLLAFVFAWKLPEQKLKPFSAREGDISSATLLVFFLCGLSIALIAVWVMRAFPNSADEYGYLFAAKTFLAGRLYNPMPPAYDLFSFSHIIGKEGKWLSQYQPGWPLILAAGHSVGLPFWLITPLCGGALLVALAYLGVKDAGKLGAYIAVCFVAVSPFFAFNAGSYFAHVPCAFFGLVFCYFAAQFLEKASVKTALLSGAAIGAVGLIRAFDVLIFALPFAVEFLRKARWMHYQRLPFILLGGAPFLMALMYDNYLVTGNSFLQVMQWGKPLLKIGFPSVDDDGHMHYFSDMLRSTFLRFGEFFEWSSPAFLAMYGMAVCVKARRGYLRFYDCVFPAIVVAYMAFPVSAGNRYGPRYYFEAYPFMAVTIGWFFAQLFDRPAQLRHLGFTKAMVGLAAGHVMTSLVCFAMLTYFIRIVVNERMDIYDQVMQNDLHHAVVVLRTGTFGTYSTAGVGELLRNGIDLNGEVIYARENMQRMGELRARFPDRKFYLYEWRAGDTTGTLRTMH
jgi:hypothetical protein